MVDESNSQREVETTIVDDFKSQHMITSSFGLSELLKIKMLLCPFTTWYPFGSSEFDTAWRFASFVNKASAAKNPTTSMVLKLGSYFHVHNVRIWRNRAAIVLSSWRLKWATLKETCTENTSLSPCGLGWDIRSLKDGSHAETIMQHHLASTCVT